jgi:hypothetical protein
MLESDDEKYSLVWVRRSLNGFATLLSFAGFGMAAGGDWIAGFDQATTIKIFGSLLTLLGIVVAILVRVLTYNVSKAVATLERIPSNEWFTNVSTDINMIRKAYRRMRRISRLLGERLGWCEGQLGKHGVKAPSDPLLEKRKEV